MRAIQKFLKNWSSLAFSGLLVQVFSFFVVIRMVRCLTPDQYGDYALLVNVATFFAVFANLGLRQVVIRYVAMHYGEVGAVSRIMWLPRLLCALLSCLLLTGYYALFTHVSSMTIILSTSFILLTMVFGDVFESLACGRQDMELIAVSNIASGLLLVILIWLVPAKYLTLLIVIILFCFAQLARVAFLCALESRQRYFAPSAGSGRDFKAFFRESLPYYWLAILTTATSSLPLLLLGAVSSTSEIALYNLGSRLTLPIMIVVQTAIGALFPLFAEVYIQERDRLFRYFHQGFIIAIYFGAIGGMLLTLFRVEIVKLLFGPVYADVVDVLTYQIWYVVLLTLFYLIGNLLAAMKRDLLLGFLSTLYVIVSLPLTFFGARYGAVAISFALLFAALVNMVYHWFAVRTLIKTINFDHATASGWLFLITCFILSIYVLPGLKNVCGIVIILILIIIPMIVRDSPFQAAVRNMLVLFSSRKNIPPYSV